MLKQDQRKIGGGIYMLTSVGGQQGLRIYRRLHPWAFSILGRAAQTAAMKGKTLEEIAKSGIIGDLMGAVGDLIANEEAFGLVNELLVDGQLHYNNKLVNPDEHWGPDRYGDIYEVIVFALDLNFGPVFRGAAGTRNGLLGRLSGLFSQLKMSIPSSPGSSPSDTPT